MGKRAGELSVRLLECGSGLRFLGRKLHRVQLPFGRNLSHVRFNDRVRVQTNGSETQLFSQTDALQLRMANGLMRFVSVTQTFLSVGQRNPGKTTDKNVCVTHEMCANFNAPEALLSGS